MLSKQKYPRLEVTAGKQLGKIYQLKKGEYSLGTHKKCTIKLAGEYASELHAVIKQNPDGVWTLTNNSPNGTYVNQLQVDSVELDQFSTIQVGAENSLDFTPLHYKQAANDSGDGSAPSKKKTNKWVWIVGAVVLVYVPIFVFLKNLGGNLGVINVQPAISLAAIENVSTQSSEYLINYPTESEGFSPGVDSIPAGISLHEKITMGFYASESEKEELVTQLVGESKAYLTSAHHYFKMNLHDKAEESLKSAMTVFPDHRYPASGYAAKTISAIKLLKPDLVH